MCFGGREKRPLLYVLQIPLQDISSRYMSTNGSSVTPVILGLLSYAPMSGYDMKRAVDRSTRFFWAASYGQIYPELRRLEAEGLIEGEDAPNGGRTRRVYRLTKAGRQALVDWLLGSTTGIELRDESLLRLFFGQALPREQALRLLEGRKRGHEYYNEVLRALEERPEANPTWNNLVLRWGIAFNEWGAKWCEQELQRLKNETKAA
jgi:PadR family transcriptional regulator AphA